MATPPTSTPPRVQSASSPPTLPSSLIFQPLKDPEALLGKVYKLPFSNYETYIQLHVYFKTGARGDFGGAVGVFVSGWGLRFFGFFFICKLLVQKKQDEKLEVVLFGNAAFILN